MASSNRIVAISSLAGAIAACLPLASNGAPSDRDAVVMQERTELAAMQAGAMEKWRRQHPAPIPQHVATTIPVTSCADDGSPGTLRSVLESVSTGDVVDLTALSCLTITVTNSYLVPNVAAGDFSIQGPGIDALTISGAHNVQVLGNLENTVISISDLSIADGYARNSWGGCLLAFSTYGGFRLTRVSVSGCEAHQVGELHGSNVLGGAIMVGGTLELTDSLVTGNTLSSQLPLLPPPYVNAMYGGGAISMFGPVNVTRSIISSNRIVSTIAAVGVQMGGGLAIQESLYDATITDSTISNNTLDSTFVDESAQHFSRLTGAGLMAYSGNTGIGDLVISSTTFDQNNIIDRGGIFGIYGAGICEAMNLTLAYSTLSSNDSPGYAGGLMARGFIAGAIYNSTFSGNHAGGKGGGIFGAGPLSIDNSTIALNSSDADGGGVYFNDTALLRSSIIAKNTGSPHPDFMVSQNAHVTGNNDFIGDPAGLPVGDGTLTGDPMLGPLADNGGPTRTHALLTGSSAIDAGSNDLHFDYDQRGAGFARVVGLAVDIGAFETGNSDEIFANGFDP